MVGPNGLRIDDAEGPRWRVALDLLAASGSETVVYQGIGLWSGRDRNGRPDPENFTAAVPSSWRMDNVTEATAREDLDRARGTLGGLREASPEFDAVVGSRFIEYVLVDDYGMGAVHLAAWGSDGFTWLPGFPPTR